MKSTALLARRILATLMPMTGTRSSGSVTVSATGADVVLPKNTIGAPVIGGHLDLKRLVRTTTDTTVTAAGVAVPITSLLGGARQNLGVAGTVIRWMTPVAGVEAASDLVATTAGGADVAGGLKDLVIYEKLGAATVASDLFRAKAGAFPAGVLAWDSSGPGEVLANGKTGVEDSWSLSLVVSRADDAALRAQEGTDHLDWATELLIGQTSVDGEAFTRPMKLRGRGRLAVSAESFVYVLRFTTDGVIRRDDSIQLGQASPWLKTVAAYHRDATPDLPLLTNNEIEMPQ